MNPNAIDPTPTSEPNYYAIIPAEVRYDKGLTANAKLLYGELTALCNKEGYCWANNDYFANLYGTSKKTISRWISSLVENQYISSTMVYKDNTREILYREIRILPLSRPIPKNVNPYGQNGSTLPSKTSRGRDKKVKDNNTYNNTSNNTSNNTTKKERKKGKKLTSYDQIINSEVTDESVKAELYEYLKMRKMIKKPMTDRALQLLINKLRKLSKNTDEAVQILDQSIESNWLSVYPLKSNINYQSYEKDEKGVNRDGSEFAEFDY